MKTVIEIISFLALIYAGYLVAFGRLPEATWWLLFSIYGDILILKRSNTTSSTRKEE